MRRTPIKRSSKPLRRTPLKASKRPVAKTLIKKARKHKTPEKKVKEELWELCKQIIRATYGNTCYTCGKTGLSGSGLHTGHFIPSGSCGAFLRYDLRNLRPQCYNCNMNLGGNGAEFYRNLVRNHGQAYVNRLFKDKNRIVKADILFYQQLVDNHREILDHMLISM